MKHNSTNQGRTPESENVHIDCLVSVFKIYLLVVGAMCAYKVIKAIVVFCTATYF